MIMIMKKIDSNVKCVDNIIILNVHITCILKIDYLILPNH